ncbi:MAG: hypothetical protein ABIK47_03345 [candidate division WOR-3 bacterium]
MPKFFAAAGRFTMEWFLSAGLLPGIKLNEGGEPAGGWGVVYCYGNRLEAVRSPRSRSDNAVFGQLVEVRTDMALLYLHNQNQILSPRLVQPFFRWGSGGAWAFCHIGQIPHPERLISESRCPDGPDPGEILFMHILERFNPDKPAESLSAIFPESEEWEISLCLISADTMVTFCRFGDNRQSETRLWLGKGELLRVVSSPPIVDLPGINWESLPNNQVIVITRERRAVI